MNNLSIFMTVIYKNNLLRQHIFIIYINQNYKKNLDINVIQGFLYIGFIYILSLF